MPTTFAVVKGLRHVTHADLARFHDVAQIRNQAGFAAELDALVRDKLREVEAGSTAQGQAALPPPGMMEEIRKRAQALQSQTAWQASASQVQRGRRRMLALFDDPHNLSVPEFALLAHKSRQQVYKDLAGRRLLGLSVGPRKQKIPDWQLSPAALQMTCQVLGKAAGIDAWTIHGALTEPLDVLGGRSAAQAAQAAHPANVNQLVETVLALLGAMPETPSQLQAQTGSGGTATVGGKARVRR